MTHPILTQTLSLPYSALNAGGKIKPDWLLTLFQDTASQQCRDLGISGFDMAAKGLKWVVAQYRIRITNLPGWLDSLVLQTWRAPWKNLYDVRCFTLSSPQGLAFASATGIWILVRAKNSRPVRLAPHLPASLMTPVSTAPDMEKPNLDINGSAHDTVFRVLRHDLDLNQHVNNTVYLKWALACCPDFLAHGCPESIAIHYLKECFFPGKIICRTDMTPHPPGRVTTRHTIHNQADNTILAALTLVWNHPGEICRRPK